MPLTRISSLITFAIVDLVMAGLFTSAFAAEELQLLSIEGNLIAAMEIPQGASDESVIDAYYALLSEVTQQEIAVHRSGLTRLIPDYEVAYLAADSAELTEVMDKISAHWEEIRSIHAQLFMQEVVNLLDRAYGNVFSVIQRGSAVQD